MFILQSPFIYLLSLISPKIASNFETCNSTIRVYPGNEYLIVNADFPNTYPRGSKCQWIAESDRPMKVTCHTLEIPFSRNCSLGSLTIHDTANQFGYTYCANIVAYIVSKSNKIVFTLNTETNMPGGRFRCILETSDTIEQRKKCTCGSRNHVLIPGEKEPKPRIAGGVETVINEYPMMSGLLDTRLKKIFCGATIINERQVITAAHCLNDRPINEIGVLVGEHDLTKVTETNSTMLFPSESYTIHPQYNNKNQDYDIAVLTIVGQITFSTQVGPVCLPFQHSQHIFDGAFVEVLGWGSTEFAGGPSNVLHKAQLRVTTSGLCSKFYEDMSTRQICTLGSGRDSCQFDSGGPVLWQNPVSGRIVEIGIISLGSICADGEPAINTRLSAFVNWIEWETPKGISYCKLE